MLIKSKDIYKHQLIGADFMVGRECSHDGPFGAILADDMVSLLIALGVDV